MGLSDQKTRLTKLREVRAELGLPDISNLKLGRQDKGEYEYTGEKIGFYECSLPYYGVPTFEVIPPYEPSKRIAWSFVSPTHHASCVVPIVNKKYAVLVRQHRPQLFTWYTDFPRGWVPYEENKAVELLKRELPGLIKYGQIDYLAQLGEKVWEDSGGRDSQVTFFVVGFQLDCDNVEQLKEMIQAESPRHIKTPVFTLAELNAWEDQGGINDLHSQTAWYRAKKFLCKNFQIPII